MEIVQFECPPMEVNIDPNAQLSEFDKRMKRAARFGIDPTAVAGPQAKNEEMVDESLEADKAFDTMQLGAGAPRVDKITSQIDRIKARQERFGEDPDCERVSKTKINQLNKRITSLKAFEKPAEIKAGAEIIPDSLYVYGVDWMSNKDIKNYIGT